MRNSFQNCLNFRWVWLLKSLLQVKNRSIMIIEWIFYKLIIIIIIITKFQTTQMVTHSICCWIFPLTRYIYISQLVKLGAREFSQKKLFLCTVLHATDTLTCISRYHNNCQFGLERGNHVPLRYTNTDILGI